MTPVLYWNILPLKVDLKWREEGEQRQIGFLMEGWCWSLLRENGGIYILFTLCYGETYFTEKHKNLCNTDAWNFHFHLGATAPYTFYCPIVPSFDIVLNCPNQCAATVSDKTDMLVYWTIHVIIRVWYDLTVYISKLGSIGLNVSKTVHARQTSQQTDTDKIYNS